MQNRKQISAGVLTGFYLLAIGLATLINLVLFRGPWFDPLERATGGLLNATLQANLLNLILFGIFIFGLGKLRPADVGLEWAKLPRALLLTAALWLGTQMLALLISAINGSVALDPLWSQRGISAGLGLLVGQLLGNALFEELVYRGLLLPQFFGRIKISQRRWRAGIATAAMLALFILSHIPNRIFQGYGLAEMLQNVPILLLWGALFTAITWVTGNLFLAIGVHALVNAPTLVTAFPHFPPQLILLALVILLLVAWRKITRPETVATQNERP